MDGQGTRRPSFPRRRAVYGTRTIRWQHLSAESRESRRDSSETRQSTGRIERVASYWLRGSIHRVGNDTGRCRALSFRIRIIEDFRDLQDCDDADASFYGYCLEASMTDPRRPAPLPRPPSFPRRRESRRWGTAARHTGFKAVSIARGTALSVIADLVRNPEVRGRAYNKPNQPTPREPSLRT